MEKKRKRIIPAGEAGGLQAAVFRPFDRKPVNYFRDMIVDEEQSNSHHVNEKEFNARVEQLLIAERQRLGDAHHLEAKQQFEAGLAKGREEAGGDFKRGLELLTEYTRVLQAEKRELVEQAEHNSVELAFMLAQKIIGAELEVKPGRVADIARLALEQVLDCNKVELKVNPEDLSYLKTMQDDLAALLSNNATLELRADKALERGSCVIETERGLLDARIASQLQTLHANLNAGAATQAQHS
jgi:flagellar assembly protein FliH